jgi:hypothetical protein
VLPSNSWGHLEPHVAVIDEAMKRAGQGTYQELDLPRRSLVRRSPPQQSR